MIETSVLANLLQNGLNQNASGIVFKIFSDDGEFQKTIRNVNTFTKYTNGIYTIVSSDVLPFKNLNIYSLTAELTIIVDVENQAKDQLGNYPQVELTKKVLNDYATSQNGQIFTISGENYEISNVYSFATVGTEQVLSPIGRCIPIQVIIQYNFTANGVNTNSVNIYIDGENVALSGGSISRVRTMANNNYGNYNITKASGDQNGLSIDLSMPLLDTTVGNMLWNDVLVGGNNNAHAVVIEKGTSQNAYLMTLGTNSSVLEINKNIGQQFSLLEVVPEIANFSSNFTSSTITVTANQNISLTMPSEEYYGIVFWGDGTNGVYTSGNQIHTYTQAGTYTIIKFIK